MADSLAEKFGFLLVEAEIDYINLWLIIGAANEASDADPALSRMQRTLALVGKMLDHGFQAVDLRSDGGCTPWPDQGKVSILRRIEREWRARPDDEPLLGAMFWFDLPASRR
jgi:hypothetical protein